MTGQPEPGAPFAGSLPRALPSRDAGGPVRLRHGPAYHAPGSLPACHDREDHAP